MPPHFLDNGGEMGSRMRGHDWSASTLGAPGDWPQSLRTATSMMLNTLQPMFIAWGDELVFLYNDAYAPILGARHPDALGRPFQDIWSDIWTDLRPLIDQALSGVAVWQEDLPLLMRRNGFPEQTYFTFTYSPLYDEAGTVAGMFCTCIETTGRVEAERRLREAAQALAISEDRFRTQGERLFALFEEAPGFVAVLEGAEHVFTLANRAYRQLIGHRDVLGLKVRDALPELSAAPFFQLLDRVYETGEPYVGAGVEARLQRTPGAPVEARFVDFVYQPIRDDAGDVTGVFVQGSDVTEREHFVDRQQTLLNELNHRVKNNLATVQSLATQSARGAPDLDSFMTDFQGRLVALSRTHDILTRNAWSGAALESLLERELSAYRDRIRLQGPDLRLNASQALAIGLIIHEMTTNAAKYGALTTPGGRVEVTWAATDQGYWLTWAEHDGPLIKAPTRTGFGTHLMKKLAGGDLGGKLELEYPPDGLRMRLVAVAPSTDGG